MAKKEHIKKIIKGHTLFCISFAICIVMLLGCTIVRTSYQSELDKVSSTLVNVTNEITKLKTQNQEEKIVYVDSASAKALDKQRWANDDTIINEWIAPAFNFDSADEYNANREKYIAELGTDDDFVQNVIPPYIAGYTDKISNENETISNGSDMNMSITKFKSYVDKVDGDNYSYVAVITCSSTSSGGGSGDSQMILTYTISKDGKISNFCAAPPTSINTVDTIK